MNSPKDEIAGDAYYVYITPRADAFPWIRIWHMPHGLEGKKGAELSGLGKYWNWSLDEIAETIGKMIVAGLWPISHYCQLATLFVALSHR